MLKMAGVGGFETWRLCGVNPLEGDSVDEGASASRSRCILVSLLLVSLLLVSLLLVSLLLVWMKAQVPVEAGA